MANSLDHSILAWIQEKKQPNTSGILAKSPASFHFLKDVVLRMMHQETYIMTNKGLQMRLLFFLGRGRDSTTASITTASKCFLQDSGLTEF
jgi:hypothetical protein